MTIGILLMAGAIAADAAPPPIRRVTLAERHQREAIARLEEAPDVKDLKQRAIFVRENREPVIVTAVGRPIA